VALLVRGKREQVRIAEALADRRGVASGCGSRIPVPAGLLLKDQRKQQVAALDPLAVLALEQPLRAGKPAAGTTHLAPAGEADPDPEGAAYGRKRLGSVEVGVVGALQEGEVFVLAPDHVRGRGEQLQVLRPERVGPIGCGERLEGLSPCLTGVGLAPALKWGDGIHQR
jgi:hypothetical protein